MVLRSFVCLLGFVSSALLGQGQVAVDLVVYGGTSAGVAAAVQGRRLGLDVLLIAPQRPLGGLSSSGLGATDIGNKAAIGGLSREFYRAVRDHYARDDAWTWQGRDAFKGRGHRPHDDAAWTFEPHVAEALFEKLVADHAVNTWRGERLRRQEGVVVEAHRIREVTMESGRVARGTAFIDATYEGDLMAAAGVTYTVGRESREKYGETCNGVSHDLATKHQFVKGVDPWRIPGDPTSELLPGIQAAPPGQTGEGDRRVQAYCFRLCATDVPENRLPWPKPDDFDEATYELLLRNFEAGDHRIPWHPVRMPNGKTDSNNNFAVSTDVIGLSHGWPEASYAERDRLFAEHLHYTQGLLWTLANHARVPERVREHYQRFGLTKDEFTETAHWPPQLYVREARRMVGAYVMTQADCQGRRVAEDPVGLAAYTMDSHNVQRFVDPKTGHVRNEGDVQVGGFPPYPISYRALLPRRDEVRNLVVPVCLSASHIAFGSIRMEPVFMVLGQSAATACALARGGALHDVAYAALRERLRKDRQVLAWTAPKRLAPKTHAKGDFSGLVLDDVEARRVGVWVTSRSVGGFVGRGYVHDDAAEKGEKSLVFSMTVDPGSYRISLAYTAHPNRSTGTTVLVADGPRKTIRASYRVDQTKRGKGDAPFATLGTLDLTGPVSISVRNDGEKGFTVVDAVRLERIE